MTRNQFLDIVREVVVEARNKLKKVYCVHDNQIADAAAQAACTKVGKHRILKYAEKARGSSNQHEFYRQQLAAAIAKGIETPIRVASKKHLTSHWGTHMMAFFPRLEEIRILNTLPQAYASKHNTSKGLKNYIKYVLFHEFGHAIERQLEKIQIKPSETKAYRQDIEKITSKGEGGSKYFSTEHMDEIFAEWSVLQDLMGGLPFKLLDIKILCYIKRKFPGGGRIKWKADKGYKITKLDYAIQSPLIQSFINCSDLKGTMERLNSMGLKVEESDIS